MQCTLRRHNGLESDSRRPTRDIESQPILHALPRAVHRAQLRSPSGSSAQKARHNHSHRQKPSARVNAS
eukprot:1922969-Lingulodinium_polyedra.AAC.1